MTKSGPTNRRPHLAKRLLATFVFFVVAVGSAMTIAQGTRAASAPNIIAYQGRLLNSNGVPVSDTSLSMIFELYTASSGGSCVWSNSSATCASATARTVTLSDGLFAEQLGDTAASTPYAAISDSTFSDNADLYLQVTVAGEALSPRKQIVAAPYALNADTIDGFSSTQAGGTSALALVLDSNGNLQLTGNPQGSGVSQGSVYINPASGVVAANEALFVVAVGGSMRFYVDGEGDVTTQGDLSISGDDLASSSVAVNLLNATTTSITAFSAATMLEMVDSTGTSTIDIGGVGQNGANTINIATHSTSADTITIGNSNASTLIGLTGGDDWSIATSGAITTDDNLAVNGGGISSTAALALTSTGGNISLGPNGSGLASITAGDDFAVGASALAAPFSVDESANLVRIGDATSDANDPTITFYASDAADSGSLSYTDADLFSFTGGNVSFTTLGTLPTVADTDADDATFTSTYSGTSADSLNTLELNSVLANTAYSAIEGTSTDHYVAGARGVLTISGSSATLTRGYGMLASLTNTSTNGSLVGAGGYLSGLDASVTHNATGTTVADVYGAHGRVVSTAGTISSATGVFGEVTTSTGTVTTAYGGRFQATTAGTTRYGLYAAGSGGTTNYSGYFAYGALQVDDDTTAAIPDASKEAGDLYVLNELEIDGNTYFGDATGTDLMTVTSATTGSTAASFLYNSLTTGTGVSISRASGGSDFDGTLLSISQSNTSATSDADAVVVTNQGAGNSVGLYITQNTLSAHAANSVGNNALVLDVNEASGSENIIVARSDADGTPDTEFRVESDGDLYADGAAYNAGADYAEFFKTSDASLGDYEIVCQDPLVAESVRRCDPTSDVYVMGVVSTNAAFVGNNLSASNDLSSDPNYRMIGMVGQIDTLVNAAEGAIAIGDPITNSSSMAGYGAKAQGPARIVGFALEALTTGEGVIRVLVQPQWYGGDVLTSDGGAVLSSTDIALGALTAATASSPGVGSASLAFRGSAWSGSAAVTRQMSFDTTVAAVDDYRLVIRNNDGASVAYVNDNGDFGISGKLFPSDRGVAQSSRYIYYDGSSGGGGDFMRTNAAGWATGSYDFAEMFPSPDLLSPGEVVVFGDAKEEVKRSLGEAYDQGIAGVVSTRPGFLAGENRSGSYPIALAGRVPTYVTNENGSIAIGDPLTTSSRPGYAMKATEPGPILGYATESFTGSVGSIITFINVSFYNGLPTAEAPAAENVVSGFASQISSFDLSGSLNLGGGSILAVGSLQGLGATWRIEGNGDLVTRGRLVQLIRSHQGEDVETFAATSRQMTVQLSGTATLEDGHAFIEFEAIDPTFNDVIGLLAPYRVLLTPYAATGTLYVSERTARGFMIREAGVSSGVAVDWLVIAVHKDYEAQALEDMAASEGEMGEGGVEGEVIDVSADEIPPSIDIAPSDVSSPSESVDETSNDVTTSVEEDPSDEVEQIETLTPADEDVIAPSTPEEGIDTIETLE